MSGDGFRLKAPDVDKLPDPEKTPAMFLLVPVPTGRYCLRCGDPELVEAKYKRKRDGKRWRWAPDGYTEPGARPNTDPAVSCSTTLPRESYR